MNELELIEQSLRKAVLPATYDHIQELSGLYDPMRYMLDGGGKRLRPRLALKAYRLFADDVTTVLPAAIGLEIYHNHTLLHDDLMDKAEIRHGKPTVHREWNDNTAILSGDVMLILAMRHLLSTPCKRRQAIVEAATITMQEVCEGQQMDMEFELRNNVTEEEYIEMIRLKTSVLPACALKVGALAANAPEQDVHLLYQYGEKIGLAFQLQDDYLDCFADPEVFGKAIGGDIRCGKKTFLLINAYQRADIDQKQTLDELLGLPEDAAEKVEGVLKMYHELSIPELVQDRIESLYREANELLTQVNAPEARKEELKAYADSLLRRQK